MDIQKFSKEEIARCQIETALELFTRQGDLFSVITLAGAAEEILGQLLRGRRGKLPLPGALTSIFRILRPGGKKNDPEAGLQAHEIDDFVHLDPRHEAVFLVGRAIEDYVALCGAPSASMVKFLNELPGKG